MQADLLQHSVCCRMDACALAAQYGHAGRAGRRRCLHRVSPQPSASAARQSQQAARRRLARQLALTATQRTRMTRTTRGWGTGRLAQSALPVGQQKVGPVCTPCSQTPWSVHRCRMGCCPVSCVAQRQAGAARVLHALAGASRLCPGTLLSTSGRAGQGHAGQLAGQRQAKACLLLRTGVCSGWRWHAGQPAGEPEADAEMAEVVDLPQVASAVAVFMRQRAFAGSCTLDEVAAHLQRAELPLALPSLRQVGRGRPVCLLVTMAHTESHASARLDGSCSQTQHACNVPSCQHACCHERAARDPHAPSQAVCRR